mmetsp:Transcript_19001/g.39595  ORF Transcript_19001/g.39595 Transcript_19001/m.39595 type:complete len:144 (+) Transcript_19001:150-581(+)
MENKSSKLIDLNETYNALREYTDNLENENSRLKEKVKDLYACNDSLVGIIVRNKLPPYSDTPGEMAPFVKVSTTTSANTSTTTNTTSSSSKAPPKKKRKILKSEFIDPLAEEWKYGEGKISKNRSHNRFTAAEDRRIVESKQP